MNWKCWATSRVNWADSVESCQQLLLLLRKERPESDKEWQEFNDDDNKILNCLHHFANIFQPLHLEGWLEVLVLGWLYHNLGPKREGRSSEGSCLHQDEENNMMTLTMSYNPIYDLFLQFCKMTKFNPFWRFLQRRDYFIFSNKTKS